MNSTSSLDSSASVRTSATSWPSRRATCAGGREALLAEVLKHTVLLPTSVGLDTSADGILTSSQCAARSRGVEGPESLVIFFILVTRRGRG